MRKSSTFFITALLLFSGFVIMNWPGSDAQGVTVVDDIVGAATWSGTVYVEDTITIKSTGSLTISAGTTVKFSSGTRLYVDGTLTASGTNASPITFTSNASTPAAGDWKGIYINSSASFTFDHATIEYGEAGLYLTGITSKSIEGQLKIDNTQLYGIVLDDSDKNTIANVTFNGPKAMEMDYGIYAYKAEGNVIKNNYFTGIDMAGIRLYEQTNNNTIENNMFEKINGHALRIDEKNFGFAPSFNNLIQENNISACNAGIYFYYVTKTNYIYSNQIDEGSPGAAGVFLSNCNKQAVSFNSLTNIDIGVNVYSSYDSAGGNTIAYNFINNCFEGIRVEMGVFNDVIDNNTIIWSHRGIVASQLLGLYPQYLEITSNIMGMVDHAITLNRTSFSDILNNTILGCKSAVFSGASNSWCKFFGNYFFRYDWSATFVQDSGILQQWTGNFYNDYSGMDTNGDGIGDTQTYPISGVVYTDSKPLCIITTNENSTYRYARIDKAVQTVPPGTQIFVPYGFYLNINAYKSCSVEGVYYERTARLLDGMFFNMPFSTIVNAWGPIDFTFRNFTIMQCSIGINANSGQGGILRVENGHIEDYSVRPFTSEGYRVLMDGMQIDGYTGASGSPVGGVKITKSYQGGYSLPGPVQGTKALYSDVTFLMNCLINRTFTLSDGAGNYELQFDQWYMFQSGKQCGLVEFFNDSDSSWEPLPIKGASHRSLGYPTNGTKNGLRPGFTGSSEGSIIDPHWETVRIDLNRFKGTTVNIRWRFHNTGEDYIQMPGWLIDDIVLYNGATPVEGEDFESGLGKMTNMGDWYVKDLTQGRSVINDTTITGFGATNDAGIRISAADVEIKNCSINQNYWNVIMARDTANPKTFGCLNITDCYMWGASSSASNVFVYGAYQVGIHDSDMYDGYDNVHLANVQKAEVAGCNIENAGNANLHLNNAYSALVYENHFNNSNYGIYGNVTELEINSNVIENHNWRGISLMTKDKLGKRALWDVDEEIDKKTLWFSGIGEYLHSSMITTTVTLPPPSGSAVALNLTHLYGTFEQRDSCQVYIIDGSKEIPLQYPSYDDWAFAAGFYEEHVSFTGNDTPVWQTDVFDVTPWAGKTVQFKFVYRSADYGQNSMGWYIGGVEVTNTPLNEDFLSGDGGFTGVGFRPVSVFDHTLKLLYNDIVNNTIAWSDGVQVVGETLTNSNDLLSSTFLQGNFFSNIWEYGFFMQDTGLHPNGLVEAYDNEFITVGTGLRTNIGRKSGCFLAQNTFVNISVTGIQTYSTECDVYIVNTSVTDAGFRGIDVQASRDLQFAVANLSVTEVKGILSTPVYIYSADNITDSGFWSSQVYNCTAWGDGVTIKAGDRIEGLSFEYNHITDNTGRGFLLDSDGYMNNITIANSNISKCSHGVLVDSFGDAQLNITGLTVMENVNHGLRMFASGMTLESRSNYFYDNGLHGYYINAETLQTNISTDTAISNGWTGIHIHTEDLINGTIMSCTASYNGWDGVHVQSTSGNIFLDFWWSNCSDNGGDGAEIAGKDNYIQGQILAGLFNNNSGVGLKLEYPYIMVVGHNQFNDNTLNGLSIIDGVWTYTANNTYYNNVFYGASQVSGYTAYVNSSFRNNGWGSFSLSSNAHAQAINTTFNKGSNLILTGAVLDVNWYVFVNTLNETGAYMDTAILLQNISAQTVYDRGQASGRYEWILVKEYLQRPGNLVENFNNHTLTVTYNSDVQDAGYEINRTMTIDFYWVQAPECTLPAKITIDEDQKYLIYLAENFTDETSVKYTGSGSRHINFEIRNGIYAMLTPDPNWNGVENIYINVTDIFGANISTVVTVDVRPVNDAPVIIEPVPDQQAMEDGASWELDLGNYESDIDNPPGQLNWKVFGWNTSLFTTSFDGSGKKLTFTLVPDAFGDTLIMLELEDGSLSDVTSIWVNVTPVNDPPVIEPAVPDQTGDEDAPAWTVDLTDHIKDIDDNLTNLAWSASPDDASLADIDIINGHTLRIDPKKDAFGQTVVNLTLTDSGGESAWRTFLLTLNPVNDAPVLSPVDNQTFKVDKDHTLNLSGHISDVDTPLDQLALICLSDQASVKGHSIIFNYPSTADFDSEEVEVTLYDGELDAARTFTAFLDKEGVTPKTTVSGNVYYGAGGPSAEFEPVKGARVSVEKDGFELGSTQADSDGYFQIKDIPLDTGYILIASPPDEEKAVYGQKGGYFEKQEELVIDSPVTRTIYLEGYTFDPDQETFTILGTVSYIGGNDDGPASNVEVTLINNQGSAVARTLTDSKGGYDFQSIPSGTGYMLDFMPPEGSRGVVGASSGYLGYTTPSFEITGHYRFNATLNHYDFTTDGVEFFRLDGNVKLESGTGTLETVSVKILLMDDSGNTVKQTWATPQGTYEFLYIEKGEYSLKAHTSSPGILGSRTGYLNFTEDVTIDADTSRDVTLKWYLLPAGDDDILPDDDIEPDDDENETEPDEVESDSGIWPILLAMGIVLLLILIILIVLFVLRNKAMQQEIDELEQGGGPKGVKTGAVVRKGKKKNGAGEEADDSLQEDIDDIEDADIVDPGQDLPVDEAEPPGMDAELVDAGPMEPQVEGPVEAEQIESESPESLPPMDEQMPPGMDEMPGDKTEIKDWDI